jgi:hypothetical protein
VTFKDYIPEATHGIICPVHGKQGLALNEVDKQKTAGRWACPLRGCNTAVIFDQQRYDIHKHQANLYRGGK